MVKGSGGGTAVAWVTAVVHVQSLAWELHAAGKAKNKNKKKTKTKKNKKQNIEQSTGRLFIM